MTVSKSFYCTSCNQIFHMKFQVDDSVYWRQWPFSLTCPNCHDAFSHSYGYENDEDFYSFSDKADSYKEGVVVGYCPTLPTPEELYYKPYRNPGSFSIFMILEQMIRHPGMLSTYGRLLGSNDKETLRYREAYPAVYRMLQGDRTNPEAISKRLANIFGFKEGEYHPMSTIRECYDSYYDMIGQFHNCVMFGDIIIRRGFDILINTFVNLEEKERIALVNEAWADSDIFKRDIKTVLFPTINDSANDLQLLLPVFLLDHIPFQEIRDRLYLVTASETKVNEIYERNYKTIVKFLPLMAGIYNHFENGDINCFKDANGNKLNYTLKDYLSLSDGKRINLILKIPFFAGLLNEALINHIRNGKSHGDLSYDEMTQTITYHDINGDHKERLIEVAHKCLLQIRILTYLGKMMAMTGIIE